MFTWGSSIFKVTSTLAVPTKNVNLMANIKFIYIFKLMRVKNLKIAKLSYEFC